MNDSCPSCLRRDIPPAVTRRRGGQVLHGYRCADCGHQWATARSLPAYSELHRTTATRPHRKAS